MEKKAFTPAIRKVLQKVKRFWGFPGQHGTALADYNAKTLTGGFRNPRERFEALNKVIDATVTATNAEQATPELLGALLREAETLSRPTALGQLGDAYRATTDWAVRNPLAAAITTTIPAVALFNNYTGRKEGTAMDSAVDIMLGRGIRKESHLGMIAGGNKSEAHREARRVEEEPREASSEPGSVPAQEQPTQDEIDLAVEAAEPRGKRSPIKFRAGTDDTGAEINLPNPLGIYDFFTDQASDASPAGAAFASALLVGGIAMLFRPKSVKGMKGLWGTIRKSTRNVPEIAKYQGKVMSGGFRSPDERLRELNKIIDKVNDPKVARTLPAGTEQALRLEQDALNQVASSPEGTAFFQRLKNLTPTQALMGVGALGVASRSGDIVQSMAGGGGGGRRGGGGPVIIN